MLLEKCDSNEKYAHHHGIVQRFWLLARAARASASRLTRNSGVTAGTGESQKGVADIRIVIAIVAGG